MVSLGRVPSVALTLVLIAAIFVGGFLVLDGLDDDLAANSYGANATAALNEGMDNIVQYAPTYSQENF